MLKNSLHKLNVTNRISYEFYNISSNRLNVQSVRWRKPISLGTAKSKMFRVPPRRKEDPEERAELFRLNSNYKTIMRSLRVFFKEQAQLEQQTRANTSQTKEFDDDFERITAINDEWNRKIAVNREKRVAKEDAERKEEILQKLIAAEERKAKSTEMIDAIVRKEKEAAKSFIKPEQLDEVIEYALANPVDYNFAIDLKHNVYHGRRTEPRPPSTKKDDPGSETTKPDAVEKKEKLNVNNLFSD